MANLYTRIVIQWPKKLLILTFVKEMFDDIEFKNKHKQNSKSFTRLRKLGFNFIMILILQKSVKSVQNRINEFFDKLCPDITPATASAFTQARSNLSHSAFIDLTGC